MIIVLIVLFSIFLYPIWPFAFKYAVFKVSLYLMIVLLIILVGRIILYLVVRLTGWSFWILPNLDDETLGFFASFRPLYSFERKKDATFEILLRLVGLIGLAVLVYFISQEPNVMNGNPIV